MEINLMEREGYETKDAILELARRTNQPSPFDVVH